MDEKKVQCKFAFKPVEKKDLSLLHTWFKKPHITKWWPVPREDEDFFNSFLKRIRSGTKPHLVLCNDLPVGYIQCHHTSHTPTNHPADT